MSDLEDDVARTVARETSHSAVQHCAECGHLEVEHKNSRTSWPHPVRFGICLIPGCSCRRYVDPNSQETA